nr:tellurite resistance TerB family protein [Bartonella tamiae]
MEKLTSQEALIYIMVTTSAADASMSTKELQSIADIVSHYPVFCDFDFDRLDSLAAECYTYLEQSDGIEQILDVTQVALPQKLRETAYALAVEVAASDLDVKQEELQFLQMMRDRWELDDLTSAAIERSARIRFRKRY